MVKFIGCEVTATVPPPYKPPVVAWLVTVTGTVLAVPMALLGMVAVNFPEATQVVASFVPLKLMTALDAKVEPSTSSVNEPLLAITLPGTNWVMVGIAAGVGGVVL